jgi:hypothetical protein
MVSLLLQETLPLTLKEEADWVTQSEPSLPPTYTPPTLHAAP